MAQIEAKMQLWYIGRPRVEVVAQVYRKRHFQGCQGCHTGRPVFEVMAQGEGKRPLCCIGRPGAEVMAQVENKRFVLSLSPTVYNSI